MLILGWPCCRWSCQPSYLPWLVYAYSSNGFTRERAVGHNTNVMGYPFPEGTQMVSFLPLLALSFLFFSYISQSLILTFSFPSNLA